MNFSKLLLSVAALAALCAFGEAKITGVTGDVVVMGTPAVPLPANVYNEPEGSDTSSPIVGGELKIGVFEEKTGISPPSEITLAGGVKLLPSKSYDSFFFFFHQKLPLVLAETATGTISFDNALVGCTSSNGEFNDGSKDLETYPIFGLDIPNFYPTSTWPARGLEGGDFATTGTELTIQTTIVQPGDYARCFTESCPAAGTCTCSAAPKSTACLAGTGAPQCFPSVSSLLAFASTCSQITGDSASYVVSGCDGSNGCKIETDGRICFENSSSTYSLSVSGTAGCGCDVPSFDLTVSPCCTTGTIVNDEGSVSSTGKCACLQG